jgi:hypothetical protein
MLDNVDVTQLVEDLLLKNEWPDSRCILVFCHAFKKNVCVWAPNEDKGILYRHNNKEEPTGCYHIVLLHTDAQLRQHYASTRRHLVDSDRRMTRQSSGPYTDVSLRCEMAFKSLQPPGDRRLRVLWDTNFFIGDDEGQKPKDFQWISNTMKKSFSAEIKCFIATAVRDELNGCSKSRQSQQAKRARDASRFLEKEVSKVSFGFLVCPCMRVYVGHVIACTRHTAV